QTGVDPHVLERAVEAVGVLPHPEALPVARPGDVEDAVAHHEAAVQGIDPDLAERDPGAAEVRSVVGPVASSSRPASPVRAWPVADDTGLVTPAKAAQARMGQRRGDPFGVVPGDMIEPWPLPAGGDPCAGVTCGTATTSRIARAPGRLAADSAEESS